MSEITQNIEQKDMIYSVNIAMQAVNISPEQPTDDTWQIITAEQHQQLWQGLNQGRRILDDLTLSEPQPSPYHQWIDGTWIDPRTEDEKTTALRNSLPDLTPRQFKLALLQHDLLDQIDQAIASIADDKERQAVQIEYQYADKFFRNSATIAKVAALLGLSDEQVDVMWLEAMGL